MISMPWIKEIRPKEATGLLKRQLDAAIQRAGRVWNIVQIMSINEMTLKDSIRFYQTLMMGDSPLSRSQREMLAVVVSTENQCYYWHQAHAHDLREEIQTEIPNPDQADAYVHALVKDWEKAPLSPADQALCRLAAKITHQHDQMSPGDLDELRAHGFDDHGIHDAVQVIAYFNYINRVAHALGVEPERFIRPWGQLE